MKKPIAISPAAIRVLRKQLELTQDQLARKLGTYQHTVARWETGVSRPRGANLKALIQLSTRAKEKEPKTKAAQKKDPAGAYP